MTFLISMAVSTWQEQLRGGLEFGGIVHDVAGVVAGVGVTAHRTFLSGSRVYGKGCKLHGTSSDPLLPARLHFPDVPQPSKAVLQAENQVCKNKWVVVI